jgi:hypothetical protein
LRTNAAIKYPNLAGEALKLGARDVLVNNTVQMRIEIEECWILALIVVAQPDPQRLACGFPGLEHHKSVFVRDDHEGIAPV